MNEEAEAEIQKARKKLEKEFANVQDSLGKLHVAFDAVRSAGVESDVYELLDNLGQAVKEARTGSLIGSGAKSHRKALEAYREAEAATTDPA